MSDPVRRPVRIAVVDDHESIVLGIREAFRDHAEFEFVGGAATVDELLGRTDDVQIVILDLRLADGSSPPENAARLMASGAEVIAYSSAEHPRLIRLAARSGVLGLVRKSAPLQELVDAALLVRTGDLPLSADLASALHSDPSIGDAELSPQEERVLELFADGLKTQAVASELGIATGTVNDYVRRIRSKYARVGRPADTKIDLYKRALEDGLLPFPGS